MKLIHKTVASIAVATTATLSLSATTLAASFTQTLNFNTTGQSIWAEGADASFSRTTDLTTSWKKSGAINPVIPGVCIIRLCTPAVRLPGVTASTDGTLGFRNTFAVSGGSVNADLPINLSLLLPDSPVTVGSTFNIGTGFSLDPSASFQTFSPSISDELKLIFDVAANLNIANIINPKFDVNSDPTLFKINNSSLDTNLLDNTNYGSVSVKVPTVNTTGTIQAGSANTLSSSGSDIFANGTLKIANIASGLLGLPPLSDANSFKFSGFSIGYNYNLLTANGILDLAAAQNFSLTIDKLPASLSLLLNDGTLADPIIFNVGDVLSVVAPTNWLGQATATIDLNTLFTNNTGVQFIPGFDISALGAGLNLPLGLDPSIGPLFSIKQRFPTSPINIYSEEFALGSFASQMVNFQVAVQPVPEPSSMLGILAFGTLGVGSLLKRKHKQHKSDKQTVEAA